KARTASASTLFCTRGFSVPSSTRSTARPNICEIWRSIPTISSSEMRLVSSKAASKSILESGRSSPRAAEPNSERRITPAAFTSESWPRKVAITCPQSILPLTWDMQLWSTRTDDRQLDEACLAGGMVDPLDGLFVVGGLGPEDVGDEGL